MEITTKALISMLQEKIIPNLKENETLCPDCKGLTFVLVESKEHNSICRCNTCYGTGKLYKCKYCGKVSTNFFCDCGGARKEEALRRMEIRQKEDAKSFELAEKVHYKDYDGYYWPEGSDNIIPSCDIREWIKEQLYCCDEFPDYLWATEGERCFSLDLKDIIYAKCEDGYEDMYSYLATDSPLIKQAQNLIDEWEKAQGDNLNIYYETRKKAVIIKDLVEEIRKELSDENE